MHSRFPGLARRLGNSASLYALLAVEYGVHLAHAEETIETVPAPPVRLSCWTPPSATRCSCFPATAATRPGARLSSPSRFYRGDRYKFVTELQPPTTAATGAR